MDVRTSGDPPSRIEGYTMREELAGLQIVRLCEFLQHIECKDIETLIRKIVDSNLK